MSVDKQVSQKQIALRLCKFMPAKTVAEILEVSTAKVAAWKAHQTMGTYKKKNGK